MSEINVFVNNSSIYVIVLSSCTESLTGDRKVTFSYIDNLESFWLVVTKFQMWSIGGNVSPK